MGSYPNSLQVTLRIFIMVHVPRKFPMVHPGGIILIGSSPGVVRISRVVAIVPESTPR